MAEALALGAALAAAGTSAIATGTASRPRTVAAMGGVAVGTMVALWARALRTLALGPLALGALALRTGWSAAIAALLANFGRRPQCPGRAHRVGEIARQRFDVQLLASQPLDIAQQWPLVIGAERNRNA